MTAWFEGPQAVFDSETTGVSTAHDRIVTACIIKGGKGVQSVVTNLLLDPGIEIPAGASRIHGITTAKARADGVPTADGIEAIASTLAGYMAQGIPVVGFNVVYDLSILHAECVRHNLRTLEERLGGQVAPVICARVLDKHVSYRKGSRKLVDCAAHYGIALTAEDAHGAEADARAAGSIVWAIAHQYPTIAGLSLEELHRNQVAWCAEQSASLEAYFRRKDPRATVCGEWPVQSLPAGWDPAAVPAVAVAS
jgi:DNA polymerase-3 subunit epsilon